MILIGPAGTGGKDPSNFEAIKKLGLDAVEVAFTYSIWMNNNEAKKIEEINKNLKLRISIHAPYYINLNSTDKKKLEASKQRILKCCERGHYMGANLVVFHPGYYGKMDKETTYQNIKKAITEIQDEIKKNKWNIKLAPETTGKLNVFGSIDEIARLKKETNCSFCIDFAHILAREGRIDFDNVFSKLKDHVLHCHFSGITYGLKGERSHIKTDPALAKKIINELKKRKLDAVVINESPQDVKDALMMKEMV